MECIFVCIVEIRSKTHSTIYFNTTKTFEWNLYSKVVPFFHICCELNTNFVCWPLCNYFSAVVCWEQNEKRYSCSAVMALDFLGNFLINNNFNRNVYINRKVCIMNKRLLQRYVRCILLVVIRFQKHIDLSTRERGYRLIVQNFWPHKSFWVDLFSTFFFFFFF